MNYESNLVYNQACRAFILDLKGVFYNIPDAKPTVDFKTLKAENALRFIISTTSLHLLTSIGIRCFILFKDAAEKEGLEFHLLCNNDGIRNTMTDLSLHGLFSILRDLKELPAVKPR